MSLTTEVIITGDKETIAKIEKIGESLVIFESAMKDIGRELAAYFSGQGFASQGGVFGERWQDLSKKYQIYKATGHTTLDPDRMRKTSSASVYPGRGPLIRTGDMQQGFQYEADNQSVTLYNEVEYFVYHQSNEPRKSGLPRRVMMAVNGDVRDIISQIINDDIKEKISKAGL